MVSSGTVKADETELMQIFSNYSSEINSFTSIWEGASKDNAVAKAEEFVSEYKSAVQTQMSEFAQAVDLYLKYEDAKVKYKVAAANYELAAANGDTLAETYRSAMDKAKSEMDSYTTKINGLLESVKSKRKEHEFVNYYQYNYTNSYGYKDYNATTPATIKSSGCGPTSAAMVLTYLEGEEIDPVTTANWSLENGYRVNGEGTALAFFPAIAEEYGYDCDVYSITEENIVGNLEQGNMIIFNAHQGTFTSGDGHYLVLTGITEDGRITVADPNSEKRSNTTYDVSTFINNGKNNLYVIH